MIVEESMHMTYIRCDFKDCTAETEHGDHGGIATMDKGWTSVQLIHGDGTPAYTDQTRGHLCPTHSSVLQVLIEGLPRVKTW